MYFVNRVTRRLKHGCVKFNLTLKLSLAEIKLSSVKTISFINSLCLHFTRLVMQYKCSIYLSSINIDGTTQFDICMC